MSPLMYAVCPLIAIGGGGICCMVDLFFNIVNNTSAVFELVLSTFLALVEVFSIYILESLNKKFLYNYDLLITSQTRLFIVNYRCTDNNTVYNTQSNDLMLHRIYAIDKDTNNC